jgi:hypothetical protein
LSSAAFVRGYLDTAGEASFVPREAMLPALFEGALLENAFRELGNELQQRSHMAWIPMQGILRTLGVEWRREFAGT